MARFRILGLKAEDGRVLRTRARVRRERGLIVVYCFKGCCDLGWGLSGGMA